MFTDRYRLKNLYAIGVLCATLLVGPSVNAGVWRDDFNGEKLSDAWKPLNDLGIWYVCHGFLLGLPAKKFGEVPPYNGLELTRFVDQREYFEITMIDLQVGRVHYPSDWVCFREKGSCERRIVSCVSVLDFRDHCEQNQLA